MKKKVKGETSPPIVTLAEDVDRFERGNLSDPYYQGSWKTTLGIIVFLVAAYFIYLTFFN